MLSKVFVPGRDGPVWLCLLAIMAMITSPGRLEAKVFDGGVDSNNLGKGEWIYVLNDMFGSYAPGVTNVSSLMAYCATNLHCQFVVIKAATGSTNFPASSNQFTTSVVNSAHANGLKIFGYTRSYGNNVPGEIAMANYVFNCGADGFVLDAEAEWESGNVVGTNGPALAMQLCGGIKTNWPTKFLAHSPFAVISFHSTFPYKEFGYWCDVTMPQDYWVDFSKTPTATVQWMDTNWFSWQNSLTGMWTNSIKPLVPIGQADATNQPGTDITEFVNYLKTDPGCVTAGGYKGCAFFRPGLQTPVMLNAIASATIGGNSAPIITAQPQAQTIFTGQNATFTITANGTPAPTYQWRLNSQIIAGATNSSYALTNVQQSNSGPYTVVVSNIAGVATSSNAVLTVTTNIVAPANIVIDNADSNFATTGSWVLATSSTDKFGASYNYASTVTGAATATGTFTPNIVTGGNYDVSIWYPEGGNRPTNAPWTVVGSNTTLNVTVNQQLTGGQWLRIATNVIFKVGSSGYVRVANNARPSVVMADAVQLSYSAVQPPFITVPPQSQSAWLGAAVTFSVQAVAYGATNFTYQWKFNGVNKAGATASSCTLANIQTNSAGGYSVTVTDAAGNATSLPATLTVTRPAIAFNFITTLPDGSVHLQLGGDPVNYILQKSVDLTNWVQCGSGSLSSGAADFYDDGMSAACFYRAVYTP